MIQLIRMILFIWSPKYVFVKHPFNTRAHRGDSHSLRRFYLNPMFVYLLHAETISTFQDSDFRRWSKANTHTTLNHVTVNTGRLNPPELNWRGFRLNSTEGHVTPPLNHALTSGGFLSEHQEDDWLESVSDTKRGTFSYFTAIYGGNDVNLEGSES